MASGNHISCGPCMFDDVTKDAGRWCTNCEEGLCEDCENVHRKGKTTRNHRVISIEDYRKIEHVSISQVCEHHGGNLEWFCKSHDEVLCVVCVPSNHKTCSDVIPISANSANSRKSTALSDLEETIDGTLREVKQCIKNRKSASKEIENQELAVKTMVLGTRTKINGHLDKLQEKLLQELKSTSQSCKSKCIKILQSLKSTEERLTKIRDQTFHMKQFSSDIQVFLGTRQFNKQFVCEVESIKSEMCATKDYVLNVSIHSIIEKLQKEVKDFGQLNISECTAMLDISDPKIGQAQTGSNFQTSGNISSITLQLIKTFQVKSTNTLNVRGCVLLPNGNILMANRMKDCRLIEHMDTGEHLRDIPVSGSPFDIAMIDLNRICVSYGDKNFIEIMNNNTFKVEQEIQLNSACFGVSYNDGRIYVRNDHSMIEVLDLSGRNLEKIKIASDCVLNITTSRDKLFYTEFKNKTVHCCGLNGEELWQVKNEYITIPYGVTVDNNNNVYVVGHTSNNLTIIQDDGKESRTLLTKTDGLFNPQAVHFDKNKRLLLLCNKNGKVALYKVV